MILREKVLRNPPPFFCSINPHQETPTYHAYWFLVSLFLHLQYTFPHRGVSHWSRDIGYYPRLKTLSQPPPPLFLSSNNEKYTSPRPGQINLRGHKERSAAPFLVSFITNSVNQIFRNPPPRFIIHLLPHPISCDTDQPHRM